MTTELMLTIDDYDKIIDEGKDTFIKVGNALIAVRDRKLWQEHYISFEDYTEVRHGFTRQRASQLIQATQTMTELQPLVDKNHMPQNERQLRTLADVAETPKDQAKVWEATVKAADKLEDGTPQVSTSLIKRVASQTKTSKVQAPLESKVIDELLSELRKAVEKPRAIIEKLTEAFQQKSKAVGVSFATHHASMTRHTAAVTKAVYPEVTEKTPSALATVMLLAEKWQATKAQVDVAPSAPKSVTSLKRT